MENFTDLDLRTPEEKKIAENKAKIASLKAQLADLKAKREHMKVAANRARTGDTSFIHSMIAGEADREKMRRSDRENLQSDVNLRDYELAGIDQQLTREMDPRDRQNLEREKAFKKNQLQEILDKNPDLVSHYYDRGNIAPQGGDTVESLKQEWEGLKPGIVNKTKQDFLGKIQKFIDENGNVQGIQQLFNEVKNTKTKEDLSKGAAEARAAFEKRAKSADKAIEAMGKDPAPRASSGSLLGSQVLDAIKDGSIVEFEYNGKKYRKARFKKGEPELWVEG
jgi:hypothetical protein